MAYINDYYELLVLAHKKFVDLDCILVDEFSRKDMELIKLIGDIEMLIKEHEALQVGHLARA